MTNLYSNRTDASLHLKESKYVRLWLIELWIYMRMWMSLFIVSAAAFMHKMHISFLNICICIGYMFLLTASAQLLLLLSDIRILCNWHILVFCAFFGSLL
jgi:hypothetical protein